VICCAGRWKRGLDGGRRGRTMAVGTPRKGLRVDGTAVSQDGARRRPATRSTPPAAPAEKSGELLSSSEDEEWKSATGLSALYQMSRLRVVSPAR
jgi:hypothetical protein